MDGSPRFVRSFECDLAGFLSQDIGAAGGARLQVLKPSVSDLVAIRIG